MFWRDVIARQGPVQRGPKDRKCSAFGSTAPMLRCCGSGKQDANSILHRVGFASPTQPPTKKQQGFKRVEAC